MCFPGWADPALFSSLIGGVGGYAVTPIGSSYVWGGYYEEGSLIWRSRWVTQTGIIESREALALPGRLDTAVVARRVICQQGDARVRVVLEPSSDFGKHKMVDLSRDDQGVWTARCGKTYLRWTGAAEARVEDAALVAEITIPEGGSHDLVLEFSNVKIVDDPPDPDQVWSATETAWSHAAPSQLTTVAERDVRHAYAVLRGLTSSNGGMVAAATMSLPERADAGRNYDYRYAWIRDQCMTGESLAVHGPDALIDSAVDFVTDRLLADGPHLKPAYRVGGGPVPDESRLDLPGYPGSIDIVGNRVNKQFQLDAYGESLLLFAAAGRMDRLGPEHWQAVQVAVDALAERRNDPEAGIWELSPTTRWTHSQLIGVAGLRSIAALAPAADGARWLSLAESMVAEASKDCLHPDGRWQRAPDDDRVDAALLLPILRGGVPIDDPRSSATVQAVLLELCSEHFAYRFRHDPRPLSEAEGAFLLCGFHVSLALGQRGDIVEAARWFERNRSACGPPGLLTEEFDVVQRQMRGNLPQAFVHATLVEAAHALAAEGD